MFSFRCILLYFFIFFFNFVSFLFFHCCENRVVHVKAYLIDGSFWDPVSSTHHVSEARAIAMPPATQHQCHAHLTHVPANRYTYRPMNFSLLLLLRFSFRLWCCCCCCCCRSYMHYIAQYICIYILIVVVRMYYDAFGSITTYRIVFALPLERK